MKVVVVRRQSSVALFVIVFRVLVLCWLGFWLLFALFSYSFISLVVVVHDVVVAANNWSG
jgi:hypothetical protein